MPIEIADRAAGATLGAFIGEALGVGSHWYYDRDHLHRDHGTWIDGYTKPKPGRYHFGLEVGDLSQAGYIAEILLDSLLARNGHDAVDFTRRLDTELFPLLDGHPTHGPGGYTSQSIREAWRKRQTGLPWGKVAGLADTTEAAERIFLIAALYAADPRRAAIESRDNTLLTQNDTTTVALTTAYASVLAALVRGEPLDGTISDRLLNLVRRGRLPFHHVTTDGSQPPDPNAPEHELGRNFPSPDALIGVGAAVRAASDPAIHIEPAWKIADVYGLPCAIYFQLPAAYYLAARFSGDFEAGVLQAINGGGQNQARAMLTGALIGAQVGLSGLPQRLIKGLTRGQLLADKSRRLGALAAQRPSA